MITVSTDFAPVVAGLRADLSKARTDTEA